MMWVTVRQMCIRDRTYHDAERTAFDIINRYMRFADKEVEKRRSEWQTNEKWAYFIIELAAL